MCVPVRLRRVPSAAVAVKGLRFASMNARRACALDRHPRCGWLAAMRRMSSSHVPHDQGHGTTAAIRAAAEPSAAHPGSHRSGGEARSAGALSGFRGASGSVLEPRHHP
jgi:hypothetical protein